MVPLFAFLIATLMAYFAHSVSILVVCLCLSLLVVCLLILARKKRLLAFAIGFALGLLNITIFAINFQKNKLPDALWQEKIQVSFQIVSEPVNDRFRAQFDAKLTELNRRVQLSWYFPPEGLTQGQHWQAFIKLKPIHGTANPGGKDYERYQMLQGNTARGYVVNKSAYALLEKAKPKTIQSLRNKIRDKLEDKPLLAALAVGERGGLSAGDWQVLKQTGTAHLIAISGLHVGLVFGIFYAVLYPITRGLCSMSPIFPAKHLASCLATGFAVIYVLLSGMGVSTLRAYVMLCFLCLFLCSYQRLNIFYTLLLTACIFLLINPIAAMQMGFILSFSTVGLIACLVQGQVFTGKKMSAALGLQWRLACLILPLSVATLGIAPLISPIANSIAIPWVSVAVVPSLLLFNLSVLLNLPISIYLLQLADRAMHSLMWVLQRLSQVGITVETMLVTPMQWVGCLCLLLTPYFYAPIFVILILFPAHESPSEGELWMTVLDVGQGLATVLKTKNHVLVYDTGPLQGSRVLLPYLRSQHVNSIDSLIISHADKDHYAGAAELLESMSANVILVGETVPQLSSQRLCEAGEPWEWDGVIFQFLHPASNSVWEGNNRSCVLKVKVNSQALLLTGDVQKPVEKHLLRTHKDNLSAQLIVAPHHGSKTSSTSPFLAAVNPEYAFVSAGFLSQYGHPHTKVLANYEAVGASVLNTAQLGAIHVKMNGSGVTIHAYRERYKRWWQ